MRLSKLLPMLLALPGVGGLNKPDAAQGNQPAPDVGMVDAGIDTPPDLCGGKIPGLGGPGMDPMQMDPSQMNFGSGSVGGANGLEGQNAPDGVDGTDDPSFDPNAQQTTGGPDFQEMMAFMQKAFMQQCEQMMQQMQKMQQMMNAQQGGGANTPPPEEDPLSAAGPAASGSGGGAPPLAMNAAAAPDPLAQQALATQSPATGQPPVTDQPPPVMDAPPAPQPPVTQPPVTQALAATNTPPASNVQPDSKTGGTEGAAKTTGASPATKQATLDGGGSYTHHLVNNSKDPIDVAYFKNNGDGPHPGFDGSSLTVHLDPGQSADVSIPDNWQGRAQKFGGKMDDPATWAEFNNEPADASKGRTEAKTWFDVSKITGANASLTMKTGDGVTAGADHGSILDAARKDPRAANILTKDASGNDVIKPAQGFDGKTNKDVVDFLTQYEPQKSQDVGGTANGKYDDYVLPNNDSATRTTSQSKEMTLTFGDL